VEEIARTVRAPVVTFRSLLYQIRDPQFGGIRGKWDQAQETDNGVYKPVLADTLPDRRRSETSDMPEPEAIRLAQGGNAAALEFIYRLHSRRVYNLCVRMVGNSGEAEGLTQDIFLHVFRKIHTFRGEAGFSTWLRRLAINIVVVRLCKTAPRSLRQLSLFSESSAGAAHLVRATVFDSCRSIEQS